MEMKEKIVLIALLFLILLSGCTKKEEKGIVTLRWVSDPNPLRFEQIKRFEKANPEIKINFDWASNELQKVLTQIAGGTPPDLIKCESATLKIFASKGVILDITDYCKRDKVNLKDIWENCSPYMYYKDRIYAIPNNAGTTVLFYNKRLFDKEGIAYPDNTWTWDKFLEVAERLTKINPKGRYYEQFGTGIDYLEAFLPWQYGADFYSEDGKRCICNSDEYKKAVRFIYDLRFKYHVSPTPTEIQSVASEVTGWGQGEVNLFCSQRLAMFFCARWGIINMRKVKDLEWGIAPVPYPREGKRVTLFGAHSTAIPSGSKHPEEAFKLLKFLLSEEYNETIIHGGDALPAVISLCKSDFFLFDPAYPKEDQNHIYIEAVEYSRPTCLSSYVSELEVGRINGVEMGKMWAGVQSPEETLDKVAQEVNKLMKLGGR